MGVASLVCAVAFFRRRAQLAERKEQMSRDEAAEDAARLAEDQYPWPPVPALEATAAEPAGDDDGFESGKPTLH
jgi:hypothetical protein